MQCSIYLRSHEVHFSYVHLSKSSQFDHFGCLNLLYEKYQSRYNEKVPEEWPVQYQQYPKWNIQTVGPVKYLQWIITLDKAILLFYSERMYSSDRVLTNHSWGSGFETRSRRSSRQYLHFTLSTHNSTPQSCVKCIGLSIISIIQ